MGKKNKETEDEESDFVPESEEEDDEDEYEDDSDEEIQQIPEVEESEKSPQPLEVIELSESDDEPPEKIGDSPPRRKRKISEVTPNSEDEPPKKKRKLSKKSSKGKKGKESKTKKKAPKKKATKKSPKSKSKSSSKNSKKKKKDEIVAIKDPEEAKEVICDYLEKQNRPYSVINIIGNLRGQVKKSVTEKSLKLLLSEDRITEKLNGKQKVYQINQETMPVLTEEEMQDLDQEMEEKKKEIENLDGEIKSLLKKKKKLQNSKTNEELKESIQKLTKIKNNKTDKLQMLKKIDPKDLITPEEKELMNDYLGDNLKLWFERKEKIVDVVGSISEQSGKKLNVLYEEIGIETDEEYKAVYKECKDFFNNQKEKIIAKKRKGEKANRKKKKKKKKKK